MKSNKINKNEEKNNEIKIIGIMLILIALSMIGCLKLTDFGAEKINLTHLE